MACSDEIARLTRRELISRMLRGLLDETQTAEALRLLNVEVDRHGIDLAGEIDAVENHNRGAVRRVVSCALLLFLKAARFRFFRYSPTRNRRRLTALRMPPQTR